MKYLGVYFESRTNTESSQGGEPHVIPTVTDPGKCGLRIASLLSGYEVEGRDIAYPSRIEVTAWCDMKKCTAPENISSKLGSLAVEELDDEVVVSFGRRGRPLVSADLDALNPLVNSEDIGFQLACDIVEMCPVEPIVE